MIDKKDFSGMRREIEESDRKREETIALSREIIRLSKRIIYSAHRDELEQAKKLLSVIKEQVKKLKAYSNAEEGHYRTAIQEYVEATCFYSLVKLRELPKRASLEVSAEHYLLGICDLSGELVRRAINSAIKGKKEDARFIRDFMEEIYGELLQFDYRNGDLRRKFDGIKYDLRKLEDLAFELRDKR
ncbi:hypothetical protein HYY72_00480 [Candidatus Woesearchaeota archaeon]|nr:hypothetical protein [Candidatus Woesearchaeota archaeon]